MSQTVTEAPVIPPYVNIRRSIERNNYDDSIHLSRPVEQFQLEPPAEASTAEDESHYPTGAKLYMVFLCIGVSLIMVGMGTSMVRLPVDLPTVRDWNGSITHFWFL